MNPAWISRRLPLSGCAVRIDDVDGEDVGVGVLRRESLAVVRSAAEVVQAARQACARRLRAARERERRWRQRTREQSAQDLARESDEIRRRALADATRIAIAMRGEREQLIEAAEIFLIEIAHQAARRLLLELPAEQTARSSARLLRDEWRATRGEGVAELRAAPDDIASLEHIADDAGWTLAPDTQLTRGQCVLTHAAGSLHASYGDNVQALLAALPGALPNVLPTSLSSSPDIPEIFE
ncbi:FliH/SctL family protein [Mitsuaria sp. 7]|uniref:FliH/SctL family protein n=1 Tax=Mitsuaria sp. 7 TaxID=1658665 RepID=UPI0007DCFD1E|nr:FliH/SctL family protein [Mitsuaria sp. 7]ANH70968.1 hypothetical protein ABE85_25910 [Mitsuaria sp. 7]